MTLTLRHTLGWFAAVVLAVFASAGAIEPVFAETTMSVQSRDSDAFAGLSEVHAAAVNLLTNGTFDEDTLPWSADQPELADWSSFDAADSPESGSARFAGSGCLQDLGATCGRGVHQCVQVAADETYTLTGKMFLPTPDLMPTVYRGQVLLRWFSDSTCTATQLGFESALISVIGSWVPYEIEATSPVGSQSLWVSGMVLFTFDAEPAVAHIDDQLLVPEPRAALLQIAAIVCVAVRARLGRWCRDFTQLRGGSRVLRRIRF